MIQSVDQTTNVVRLSRVDQQALVDAAIRAAPREACGILAGRDGVVERVYECENVYPDEHGWRISAAELGRVLGETEAAGTRLVGCWHSHPRSWAYPSRTDVEGAPPEPGWLHVIVGLRSEAVSTVRGFEITLGVIREVSL
jgi:proteasome lid subunit RPN8/RPN11